MQTLTGELAGQLLLRHFGLDAIGRDILSTESSFPSPALSAGNDLGVFLNLDLACLASLLAVSAANCSPAELMDEGLVLQPPAAHLPHNSEGSAALRACSAVLTRPSRLWPLLPPAAQRAWLQGALATGAVSLSARKLRPPPRPRPYFSSLPPPTVVSRDPALALVMLSALCDYAVPPPGLFEQNADGADQYHQATQPVLDASCRLPYVPWRVDDGAVPLSLDDDVDSSTAAVAAQHRTAGRSGGDVSQWKGMSRWYTASHSSRLRAVRAVLSYAPARAAALVKLCSLAPVAFSSETLFHTAVAACFRLVCDDGSDRQAALRSMLRDVVRDGPRGDRGGRRSALVTLVDAFVNATTSTRVSDLSKGPSDGGVMATLPSVCEQSHLASGWSGLDLLERGVSLLPPLVRGLLRTVLCGAGAASSEGGEVHTLGPDVQPDSGMGGAGVGPVGRMVATTGDPVPRLAVDKWPLEVVVLAGLVCGASSQVGRRVPAVAVHTPSHAVLPASVDRGDGPDRRREPTVDSGARIPVGQQGREGREARHRRYDADEGGTTSAREPLLVAPPAPRTQDDWFENLGVRLALLVGYLYAQQISPGWYVCGVLDGLFTRGRRREGGAGRPPPTRVGVRGKHPFGKRNLKSGLPAHGRHRAVGPYGAGDAVTRKWKAVGVMVAGVTLFAKVRREPRWRSLRVARSSVSSSAGGALSGSASASLSSHALTASSARTARAALRLARRAHRTGGGRAGDGGLSAALSQTNTDMTGSQHEPSDLTSVSEVTDDTFAASATVSLGATTHESRWRRRRRSARAERGGGGAAVAASSAGDSAIITSAGSEVGTRGGRESDDDDALFDLESSEGSSPSDSSGVGGVGGEGRSGGVKRVRSKTDDGRVSAVGSQRLKLDDDLSRPPRRRRRRRLRDRVYTSSALVKALRGRVCSAVFTASTIVTPVSVGCAPLYPHPSTPPPPLASSSGRHHVRAGGGCGYGEDAVLALVAAVAFGVLVCYPPCIPCPCTGRQEADPPLQPTLSLSPTKSCMRGDRSPPSESASTTSSSSSSRLPASRKRARGSSSHPPPSPTAQHHLSSAVYPHAEPSKDSVEALLIPRGEVPVCAPPAPHSLCNCPHHRPALGAFWRFEEGATDAARSVHPSRSQRHSGGPSGATNRRRVRSDERSSSSSSPGTHESFTPPRRQQSVDSSVSTLSTQPPSVALSDCSSVSLPYSRAAVVRGGPEGSPAHTGAASIRHVDRSPTHHRVAGGESSPRTPSHALHTENRSASVWGGLYQKPTAHAGRAICMHCWASLLVHKACGEYQPHDKSLRTLQKRTKRSAVRGGRGLQSACAGDSVAARGGMGDSQAGASGSNIGGAHLQGPLWSRPTPQGSGPPVVGRLSGVPSGDSVLSRLPPHSLSTIPREPSVHHQHAGGKNVSPPTLEERERAEKEIEVYGLTRRRIVVTPSLLDLPKVSRGKDAQLIFQPFPARFVQSSAAPPHSVLRASLPPSRVVAPRSPPLTPSSITRPSFDATSPATASSPIPDPPQAPQRVPREGAEPPCPPTTSPPAPTTFTSASSIAPALDPHWRFHLRIPSSRRCAARLAAFLASHPPLSTLTATHMQMFFPCSSYPLAWLTRAAEAAVDEPSAPVCAARATAAVLGETFGLPPSRIPVFTSAGTGGGGREAVANVGDGGEGGRMSVDVDEGVPGVGGFDGRQGGMHEGLAGFGGPLLGALDPITGEPMDFPIHPLSDDAPFGGAAAGVAEGVGGNPLGEPLAALFGRKQPPAELAARCVVYAVSTCAVAAAEGACVLPSTDATDVAKYWPWPPPASASAAPPLAPRSPPISPTDALSRTAFDRVAAQREPIPPSASNPRALPRTPGNGPRDAGAESPAGDSDDAVGEDAFGDAFGSAHVAIADDAFGSLAHSPGVGSGTPSQSLATQLFSQTQASTFAVSLAAAPSQGHALDLPSTLSVGALRSGAALAFGAGGRSGVLEFTLPPAPSAGGGAVAERDDDGALPVPLPAVLAVTPVDPLASWPAWDAPRACTSDAHQVVASARASAFTEWPRGFTATVPAGPTVNPQLRAALAMFCTAALMPSTGAGSQYRDFGVDTSAGDEAAAYAQHYAKRSSLVPLRMPATVTEGSRTWRQWRAALDQYSALFDLPHRTASRALVAAGEVPIGGRTRTSVEMKAMRILSQIRRVKAQRTRAFRAREKSRSRAEQRSRIREPAPQRPAPASHPLAPATARDGGGAPNGASGVSSARTHRTARSSHPQPGGRHGDRYERGNSAHHPSAPHSSSRKRQRADVADEQLVAGGNAADDPWDPSAVDAAPVPMSTDFADLVRRQSSAMQH